MATGHAIMAVFDVGRSLGLDLSLADASDLADAAIKAWEDRSKPRFTEGDLGRLRDDIRSFYAARLSGLRKDETINAEDYRSGNDPLGEALEAAFLARIAGDDRTTDEIVRAMKETDDG